MAIPVLLSLAAVAGASPMRESLDHEKAANAIAQQMINDVVLPSGSTELSGEPSDTQSQLDAPVSTLFYQAEVDRVQFWSSDSSPSDVIASVEAHPPAGAQLLSKGYAGSMSYVGFTLPVVNATALGQRQLIVEAAPGSGRTDIRADAEVQYVAPRPTDLRVKGAAATLTLVVSNLSTGKTQRRKFTNRDQVASLAATVDSLPFAGNTNVVVRCESPDGSARDRFVFRAISGRVIAVVEELDNTSTSADPCALTSLVVRGRKASPLLDGGILLDRAQRLLGVKLVPRPQ